MDVLIKENRAVYSFWEFYWIKNLIGENIDFNHFLKDYLDPVLC